MTCSLLLMPLSHAWYDSNLTSYVQGEHHISGGGCCFSPFLLLHECNHKTVKTQTQCLTGKQASPRRIKDGP